MQLTSIFTKLALISYWHIPFSRFAQITTFVDHLQTPLDTRNEVSMKNKPPTIL